jgi:hypothetical protein
MQKRNLKSKKGAMLMTISLFMVFAVIAGLGSYYSFKMWAEKQKVNLALEPQLYIGEKQMDLLLLANQVEMDLFYMDQAARYSVAESLLRLGEKGGFAEEPECGNFIGYNLVKDENKFCDMTLSLDGEISNEMNDVFYSYAMRHNVKLPSEFEYSFIQEGDILNVLGTNDEMMEYEIGRAAQGTFFGTTNENCHYCGPMRDSIPADEMENADCKRNCCLAPCPEEARRDRIPLIPYLNQCGDSETKEYEDGCDTSEVATLCGSGCGPTSANMILEYYEIPSDLWYFFNSRGPGSCYAYEGYDAGYLRNFLNSKNIRADYKDGPNDGNTWDDLIKATRDGPVIMLQSQEAAGLCRDEDEWERDYCVAGHYIVVLYANENYAIVNDPYAGWTDSRDIGNNLVLSKVNLERAWDAKDNAMIAVKGREFDANFDPYKDVLIENNLGNWVRYYPLDSTKSKHLQVNNVFSEVSCPSGNDFNYGVNLGVDEGDNIYAIAGGKVIKTSESEDSQDYNTYNVLEIDHNNGYLSRYYFTSEIYVSEGDFVMAGQRIAAAGSIPGTNSQQFYFEIHRSDYVNGISFGNSCLPWIISPKVTALDPLSLYFESGSFTMDLKFTPLVSSQSGLESLPYYDYMMDEENQVIWG